MFRVRRPPSINIIIADKFDTTFGVGVQQALDGNLLLRLNSRLIGIIIYELKNINLITLYHNYVGIYTPIRPLSIILKKTLLSLSITLDHYVYV